MGFKPKCTGGSKRIYSGVPPPRSFITGPMDLTMMRATERHRKLVTRLAAECTSLRKTEVMRIRWTSTANQARLFDNMPDVLPITNTARFRKGEETLIDVWYPNLLA